MIAALTTSEKLQLAAVCVTAVATMIALASVVVANINERIRSQPIVIAHEAGRRQFAPSGSSAALVVDAYLTSDGVGAAFNVRFGVEFAGVRYPYRLTANDPGSGNVQRVLRPGDRRPESDSWPILIDSLSMWGRAAESEGDLDANRVYWARYENAKKQTWETRNPGDRSAKLDIRRVYWPRKREWREQRRRAAAGQHDAEWVQRALAELRARTNKPQAPDSVRPPGREKGHAGEGTPHSKDRGG